MPSPPPRDLLGSLKHLLSQPPSLNALPSQVLSRDIRSVTQRIKVPQRAQHGAPAALSSTAGAGLGTTDQQQASEQGEGFWKVVLDGIQISYDVEEGSSNVVLRSAELV